MHLGANVATYGRYFALPVWLQRARHPCCWSAPASAALAGISAIALD